MEFENLSKVQKLEDHGSSFFEIPLNNDDVQKSPVGTFASDAEIMQDLDGIIQNGQESEIESSCGCSTPCACSGSPCSCGSGTSSELANAISNSMLELTEAFETVFSSAGSSSFEQMPMEEFLETAEQAFDRLFNSLIDTTKD